MDTSDASVVLTLAADALSSVVVRATLIAFARESESVQLTDQEIDEVSVAVQEACTNVLRHAYGGRRGRRFRVELRCTTEALEVCVCDDGKPFELPRGELPDPELLQVGGYGTFIMRSWMHEVDVERRGGENVLRMVRRYAAPVTAEVGDAAD